MKSDTARQGICGSVLILSARFLTVPRYAMSHVPLVWALA